VGLSLVSVSFFLFFGVVFAANWTAKTARLQNWVLLVASYLFYAFFDWRYCALLAAASVAAVVLGRLIAAQTRLLWRRTALLVGLGANVGVLGILKYSAFFAQSANALFERLGLALHAPTLALLLPVGLSFFLFKIVSYLIDVYRDSSRSASNVVAFLVYVAFFPQILSGPVDRSGNLLPQLAEARCFDYSAAAAGARQVLWGVFKKLAVADGLAVVVNAIMTPYQVRQGPELAFGMVLYSLLIYCDFSGYTDISIGLSRLLGIRAMRNFAYPYFSQSVAEFWRRWNISVSSWFRDYVYIPLGGSRKGSWRLFVSVLLTFLLSGLWHGASYNYIAWGGMLGLGVAFTAVRRRPVLRESDTAGGDRPDMRTVLRMLATFSFVTLAWVFFRSGTLSEATTILGRILLPTTDLAAWSAPLRWIKDNVRLCAVVVAFLAVEWMQRRRPCPLEWPAAPRAVRWIVYTALLWLTILLMAPGGGGDFVYFRY
jgi:alginate O-acetyltransferase complex protein AlgI